MIDTTNANAEKALAIRKLDNSHTESRQSVSEALEDDNPVAFVYAGIDRNGLGTSASFSPTECDGSGLPSEYPEHIMGATLAGAIGTVRVKGRFACMDDDEFWSLLRKYTEDLGETAENEGVRAFFD